MEPSERRSLGFAGSPRTIATIGACIVTAGLAIVVVRFLGRSPAETALEAWLGSLALGAVVAAPGVLAVLALWDRPALLLPAATVLVPVSFLSFAGILLPLLVPAVLLFVAYGRRSALRPGPPVRTAATLAWVQVLLMAAVAALLVHQDPRAYVTELEQGSTSDVVTVGGGARLARARGCRAGRGLGSGGPRKPPGWDDDKGPNPAQAGDVAPRTDDALPLIARVMLAMAVVEVLGRVLESARFKRAIFGVHVHRWARRHGL